MKNRHFRSPRKEKLFRVDDPAILGCMSGCDMWTRRASRSKNGKWIPTGMWVLQDDWSICNCMGITSRGEDPIIIFLTEEQVSQAKKELANSQKFLSDLK